MIGKRRFVKMKRYGQRKALLFLPVKDKRTIT